MLSNKTGAAYWVALLTCFGQSRQLESQVVDPRLSGYLESPEGDPAPMLDGRRDTTPRPIGTDPLPILQPCIIDNPEQRAFDAPLNTINYSTNVLTFTFNSPAHPWSPSQVAEIQGVLDEFYPIVLAIYGPPGLANVVNIVYDPTVPYAGSYSPSSNTLTLKDPSQHDVIVHEIVHAFRDDLVLGPSVYEEGMARAVEVAAFGLAGETHPFDDHHSYPIDVYYEAHNTASVGSFGGNVFAEPALTLLRYQQAGYAWGKTFLADPEFFIKFHEAYYPAVLADQTVRFDPVRLENLVKGVLGPMDGQFGATWYANQHIFEMSDLPLGYQLFARHQHGAFSLAWTIDYFYRDPGGPETAQAGKQVDWDIRNLSERRLAQGTDATTGLGWVGAGLNFYNGAAQLRASVTSPAGPIQLHSYGVNRRNGVFGLVVGAAAGELTVTPVADPSLAGTTEVVGGVFNQGTIGAEAGVFELSFKNNDGLRAWRVITKDASDYFVRLDPTPATFGDIDGDGAITIQDMFAFENCLEGPSNEPGQRVPPTTDQCVEIFDHDGDGDVDAKDFSALQNAW